jgi:hypothetical protein
MKVALRCADEQELLLLQAQARSLNLCAHAIQDAWVLPALYEFSFSPEPGVGHRSQRVRRPCWELQVTALSIG